MIHSFHIALHSHDNVKHDIVAFIANKNILTIYIGISQSKGTTSDCPMAKKNLNYNVPQ
jgi:methylglyoxal synthase